MNFKKSTVFNPADAYGENELPRKEAASNLTGITWPWWVNSNRILTLTKILEDGNKNEKSMLIDFVCPITT